MEVNNNSKLARRKLLHAELNRMVDIMIKEYKPQKVILFGSLVGGNTNEWSDIDLLVVKDTNKDYYEGVFELDDILECKVGLDLIVLNVEEFNRMSKENKAFKRGVLEKGKILYESNS